MPTVATAPAIDANDPSAQIRAAVADRLAAGSFEVPMLPQVASQVSILASSADADAPRLSALIHRDAVLAGHVLRIANSPAYMPRMPIVSLQQAVARLGLQVVAEIAFAASVQSGVFRVPGYESVLKQLWRHSLASGAFAKEIARARRFNVESAFLCGLLHAVGRPAMLQLTTDAAKALRLTLTPARVFTLLDDGHQEVGALVAAKWELPKPVCAAITHYQDYRRAAGFEHDAMVTFLADRLATHLTVAGAFDETSVRDHAVFADLNLYPDDVNALLAKKESVARTVDAMTV
ncbi:MAG TPA: HDOD domain-containing protein [Polyangia bacterium]|jgi:HD-like signal output (HDOD) protein|nr:HDOD domain-containing protein [Polyangia bacterium]